ncbi:MAG: hypothetical protein ACNA8W_22415 [Bradymonadaceae bacterium]
MMLDADTLRIVAGALMGSLTTLGAALFAFLAKRKDSDVALRESVNAQTQAMFDRMEARITELEKDRDYQRREKHEVRAQLSCVEKKLEDERHECGMKITELTTRIVELETKVQDISEVETV